MSVQNDFLPFAAEVGANVISQATYAGLAARTGGFSAGVAPSAALNKAWRQSSIIAAAVAQLIADTAGAAVVDDGTTATIEANLATTIRTLAAAVSATQITALHLGNVAQENIGQGLEDDGGGNLRVKLIDGSVRRTAAGVQTAVPLTTVPGNLALTAAHQGAALLTTASSPTLTAPLTTTLWNGFAVTISAIGGPVTFTPNGADKINGGAAGSAYTVVTGQTVEMVTDGAGNWWPIFQTTPLGAYTPAPVTGPRVLGAGTYQVDTTTGGFTVTLATGIAAGTTVELYDPFGSWGINPLIVNGNGNTIQADTNPLVCNVSGESVRIIFNGSDWRLY